MSARETTPVDPELRRQLDAAGDRPVEAVFTLRPPAGKPVMEAAAVQKAVDRIMKSAGGGEAGADVHVMPFAQAFAVAAPAAVVKAILSHGGVASAVANAQPESLAIDPPPPHSKSTRRGGRAPKGKA